MSGRPVAAGSPEWMLHAESIRQLKYRYARCIDCADAAGLSSLLHPDVRIRVPFGAFAMDVQGREAFLAAIIAPMHGEMVVSHNVHHPEIELLSDVDATGTWYLQDLVIDLRSRTRIRGAGLYRERYARSAGGWQISDIVLERIYECAETLPTDFHLTAHWLGRHFSGAAAP